MKRNSEHGQTKGWLYLNLGRFRKAVLLSALFFSAVQISSAKGSNSLEEFGQQQNIGQKTITGTIIDKSGDPLIGVSVAIEGTTIGTLTDIDGKYSLNVSEGNVVVVSYVGYVTERITVKSNTNVVDLKLKDSDINLDVVVVTALGIKRSEKALSYNVQQISSDELNTVKDANFINSLAGKVAGVTINASSGGTGASSRVVMRGAKSISKDNNVMYVIDGIPLLNSKTEGDLGEFDSMGTSDGVADINPEDIESMSVLSGPSAAALYGSAAANGVILITTKKGTGERVKVSLSNQTTFSNPFVMPKFQNKYGNQSGIYESWGDELSKRSSFDPKDFFNTGVNVQNTVSLSVGSKNSTTYGSIGSVNSTGIMPNNEYDRYNFTFNNSTKFLDDKMTLDFGMTYVQQKDRNLMTQGRYYNPLVALYTFPRGEDFDDVRHYEEYSEDRKIYTQRWNWGDQLEMQNPYWAANRNIRTNSKRRYMMNAGLKYEVADWLTLSGRAKLDDGTTTYKKRLMATTLMLFAENEKGFYERTDMKNRQIYADFLASANKSWNDYSLAAVLGTSFQEVSWDKTGYLGRLKDIPNFFSYYNVDRAYGRATNEGTSQQTQAIFASAELGWKSMLYLSVTGRNEWDSALAQTDNKSFFYPSVGLSAVISEMVALPKVINYMKVRASYASVGNAIPVNLSIPTYKYADKGGGMQTQTYRPYENLKPERTDSWEAGISAKFLNNKFNLDATVYRSNTKDQTLEIAVSPLTGYSSIYVQTGDIQNQGLEFALGYTDNWGDFGWSSNVTLSRNWNKVKSLGDYTYMGQNQKIDRLLIKNAGVGDSRTVLKEGGTLGDIWYTSQLKKDAEGNIFIDPATGKPERENIEEKKLGSTLPNWNIGFRNDFTWKDITLGVLITARTGGIVMSPTQGILDQYGVSKASGKARDNGGIPVNNGMVDAYDWYSITGGINMMSNYTYSATNIRLQELSLGYSLPRKWFDNKMKMHVSFVGRNLLMIYNKAPFDPEATSTTNTYYQGIDYFMQPSLRNLGFSVKLEF